MYKNFPLSFVSEDALQLVGQSWAAQYQPSATKMTAQRDFRLRAELLAIYSREIETHKWYLSETLGRDVGFHVAAADYLENIKPVDEKNWLQRLGSRLAKLLALNLNFDGPNSLLNFERSMRGTRSLAR